MKIKSNYAGDLNLNDFYIQAVAKGVGNRIKNAHLQIPRDGI
jgi:hypothetical protein